MARIEHRISDVFLNNHSSLQDHSLMDGFLRIRSLIQDECRIKGSRADKLCLDLWDDRLVFGFVKAGDNGFSTEVYETTLCKDAICPEAWGGYLGAVHGYFWLASRAGYDEANRAKNAARDEVIGCLEKGFPKEHILFSKGSTTLRALLSEVAQIWTAIDLDYAAKMDLPMRPQKGNHLQTNAVCPK